MNKQEFEDRTGFIVPEENYSFIEKTYMLSGNLDKDTFCKDYKEHGESIIIDELTKTAINQEETIKSLKSKLGEEIHEQNCFRNDMALFLINEDQLANNDALRRKAIELVGERMYLKLKIELGHSLSQEDAELVYNILNI